GQQAGSYNLEVDVREAGSQAYVDSYLVLPYTLQASQTLRGCASVSLSTNPSSPTPAGSFVTLRAASSGCPSPQYRFWVEVPGQPWTLMQDYSSRSSFIWNTAGLPTGSYNLEVDVRQAGSQAYVESYVVNAYSLLSP
ncbi:MAG: hypothetical protein ACR2PL_11490, partial [Dehalococcoidia bacterium]